VQNGMASVNAKDRYIVSDCSYSIKKRSKAGDISFDMLSLHMLEIIMHTHKDFFLIKKSDVRCTECFRFIQK